MGESESEGYLSTQHTHILSVSGFGFGFVLVEIIIKSSFTHWSHTLNWFCAMPWSMRSARSGVRTGDTSSLMRGRAGGGGGEGGGDGWVRGRGGCEEGVSWEVGGEGWVWMRRVAGKGIRGGGGGGGRGRGPRGEGARMLRLTGGL